VRKLSLIIIIFIGLGSLHSLVTENANLMNFFFGTESECQYDKWESHIVEGVARAGYNMYAPYDRQTQGFGQFTLPSEEQTTAWELAVDHFFAGEYENAQTTLTTNNIPYTVVKFIDGNVIYYMLRENLNMSYHDDNGTTATYDDEHGSFDFGWGIFVYKVTNTNPVLVSAPHPNDDFISPYLAVKNFKELNAQYLMINGSGREALWSGSGAYNNAKSLCDPTRRSELPFNYFYTKACDQIREDFGRRELSLQIHSYDWDSHSNKASCQISPGQSNRPAGLPIRDFSALQNDVIQNTNYVVVPQGTIGANEEVTVRDYYSVWNDEYDTVYQDTLIVSNDVDLPGYGGSIHEQYSTSGYSQNDVFSPFFHVEFDELPNCYPQTEEMFKWLYGFNSYTETWNFSQRYTKIGQYYQPFINSLKQAVLAWVVFDDGLTPQAPTNLERYFGASGNSVSWDATSCYDFYSYELLVSNAPLNLGGYSIVNRDVASGYNSLAFPMTNYVTILNLEMNQQYHVAIRTVDYNGNISELSEEITFMTLPIVTSPYTVKATDTFIKLSWTLTQHQNSLGFDIYRSEDDEEFQLYESYTDLSTLIIGSGHSSYYSFTDNNVELDTVYRYRVEVMNNQNISSVASPIMEAVLTEYKYLTVNSAKLTRTLTLGQNSLATNGYDDVYDLTTTEIRFAWEEDEKTLARNIIAEFDPTSDYRSLNFFVDYLPASLNFSLSSNRSTERFYIDYNNQLYSLNSTSADIEFPAMSRNYAKLIWGNLQAKVNFPELANYVAYQGDTIELEWQANYSELVSSYDLYLKNDTDSLFIVSGLPATQTSYQFVNNHDQNYRMIDFMVRVHCSDGEIIDYKSDNKLVLQSQIESISLFAEESNYLFAYPFVADYNISQLADFQAYNFVGGAFAEATTLNANSSFFISTSSDVELFPAGNPILEDTQYLLNSGWNMFRNVHPFDYSLKDIMFDRNNNIMSFRAIQESGAILPVIMGIRDGSYTPIQTLKAYESAFLYKLDNQLLNIRFKPNNEGKDSHIIEPELFFTIEFKTTSGSHDELTIGYHSNLTPMIDNYYDFVKPPLRPTYGITEAYIVPEAPLVNYFPKMHTKLSEPPTNDYHPWNIAFTNTLNEPVQARIKATNSVADYAVTLYHGGNSYRLGERFVTLVNTSQSGTYEAQLTLFNATDNSDNEVVPVSDFLVSPNPIRDFAKFSVKNNRSNKFDITVYNLRGQKVKSFKVTDCKDANTSISWNLTNDNNEKVSSGVYFVKYQNGKQNELRKICVMK